MDKPDSAAPLTDMSAAMITPLDRLAAAAPRQPEGPDLSEGEIATAEKLCPPWSTEGRALAEVKRRRAQPADAAPLVALRESARWAISDWERRLKIGARGNIVEPEPEAIRRLRTALAAAPRDEHRTDCAKKRGLAVCVCASPAAAPIGAPDARLDLRRDAMEAAANVLADLGCAECGHTPDDPFEPDGEHGETHCTDCADWLAAYEKLCAQLGWTRKELIGGEWVAIPDKPKAPPAAASLEVEALDAKLVEIQTLCRNDELDFDPRSGIDRLAADARAVLRRGGR